jgi:hypothetical protein
VTPAFRTTFLSVTWVPFACPCSTFLLHGSMSRHECYNFSTGSIRLAWCGVTVEANLLVV